MLSPFIGYSSSLQVANIIYNNDSTHIDKHVSDLKAVNTSEIPIFCLFPCNILPIKQT